MVLLKQLSRIFNLLTIRVILSNRLRKRADKYFNRTLRDFRKRYRKEPDNNEKFLLVVKASHRTSGAKHSRGKRGHIKRQWIRKYLLLKYKIRNDYKIQKSREKYSEW